MLNFRDPVKVCCHLNRAIRVASRLTTGLITEQELFNYNLQSVRVRVGLTIFGHPCSRAVLVTSAVSGVLQVENKILEMWANTQRDGRPAEYRWRPLFNEAVWLTPTTRVPCSNAVKDAKRVEITCGAPN